ncbi:MAG: lysozyme inhibitor LprI family protein [Bradyrhizobium sp.]
MRAGGSRWRRFRGRHGSAARSDQCHCADFRNLTHPRWALGHGKGRPALRPTCSGSTIRWSWGFQMSIRLAALYLALTVLALGSASAAGLPVAQKVVVFKDKKIDASVKYPQTGNKAIDAVLADYARKSVADFKTFETDMDEQDRQYLLETGYTVQRNDGKMFAVLFTIYEDTGGAHPNSDYETFNFLLPDGAQVFLAEIVEGSRGIKRVADLAAANLMRGRSADDFGNVPTGTAPIAVNFKNFVWLPDRLDLFFPPYQVASYAEGPQQTTIPLSRLRDVIRRDWRAPAASFDCSKAATVIEHAICADAALARLDRQTAEAYQSALRNAYEPNAQAKLRQEQRDWLAKRNAACGGEAPAACLAKFYRDRLAELVKSPA